MNADFGAWRLKDPPSDPTGKLDSVGAVDQDPGPMIRHLLSEEALIGSISRSLQHLVFPNHALPDIQARYRAWFLARAIENQVSRPLCHT